jgi:Ethanolamine utilization protein EutJ (predicted chaperonin)
VATYRLAIDLGTSHTVAVVRRGDEAPRPLLFDGSPLLPSAIFAEPPRLHVGRDAERLSLVDPSRFEPHPKRRIDDGSVLLGNTEVRVVDMLAELLRRAVAEAAQAGVSAGGGVVLTCPADWGAHRRNVLVNAAHAAGLGQVELVDEPVAAATYCVDVLQQEVSVGRTVAVFDFGGGTLDVSVLRRESGGLRVLSVGGLDDLGGVDVDAALVGHLGQLIALRSPRLWQRFNNPGPQSEQRERRQFWNEVRGAKEMLSRTSAAPIHVPGMDSALHITREELERVAGPLIDRAVDETRRVLQRSGTDNDELAGLFLVGGSSRIPLVASRLHTRFGIAPTVPEQPELPVAYGGLIAASGRPSGQAAGRAAPPRAAMHSPPAGAPPVSLHRPPATEPPRGRHAQPVSGPASVSAPPVSTPPAMPVSPATTSSAFPVSYPPIPTGPSTFAPPGQAPPGQAPPGRSPYPPGPPQGMAPPGMAPPGMAPHARPPGGPPGRPMAPTMVPHPPPRRRRGRLRYVVLLIVFSLVALCGWGGYTVYGKLADTFRGTGNPGGLPGFGNNGDGNGDAGDLKKLAAVTVPGTGGMGATVGPESAFYAGVEGGKIRVIALNLADGKERWNKTFDAEPTELRLRQAGDLLVVDGEKAATHQGKDIRLVIDAKTGTQKRLDPHDEQRVVAYFGGEIIVDNDRPSSAQRIDLATGTVKWTASTKDISGFGYAIVPALVYAADGPTGPQGRAGPLPWTVEDPAAAEWQQALAADPGALVAIDPDAGKATVLDPTNGKAKGSGGVPLDGEDWTAYGGLIIGVLNDKASPGRTTIGAYGLDNFGERWKLALPAGADVERIKPCGQQHICAAYDGDSKWHTVAIDIKTGKDAWTRNGEFSEEPDWYLMGAGMVCGQGSFGLIDKPGLCDIATGNRKHGLGGSLLAPSAVAGAGKLAALRGVRSSISGTTWTVATVDLTSGKVSSAVDVSAKLTTFTTISGGIVATLAEDRKLVVARAP